MPEIQLARPNLQLQEITLTVAQKALLQDLPKCKTVSWQDGKVRVHKTTGTNIISPIDRAWLETLQPAYPGVSFIFVDNYVDNPNLTVDNGKAPDAKPKAIAAPEPKAKANGWLGSVKPAPSKSSNGKPVAKTPASAPAPEPVQPVAEAHKPTALTEAPKALESASAPASTTSLREAALKAVTEALTGKVEIAPDAHTKLAALRASAVTAELYRYARNGISTTERDQVRSELVDAIHASMRLKLIVDAEIENARRVLDTL
jgi:hypothetical protein